MIQDQLTFVHPELRWTLPAATIHDILVHQLIFLVPAPGSVLTVYPYQRLTHCKVDKLSVSHRVVNAAVSHNASQQYHRRRWCLSCNDYHVRLVPKAEPFFVPANAVSDECWKLQDYEDSRDPTDSLPYPPNECPEGGKLKVIPESYESNDSEEEEPHYLRGEIDYDPSQSGTGPKIRWRMNLLSSEDVDKKPDEINRKIWGHRSNDIQATLDRIEEIWERDDDASSSSPMVMFVQTAAEREREMVEQMRRLETITPEERDCYKTLVNQLIQETLIDPM